jgi:caffeoyl-CoA O-methyltransferase
MADAASRAGRTYVDPAILEYVTGVHAAHDPALARAFDAPARHGMPAIQLAPSEGKLLELLVKLVGARRIVEIGTLAGYSAIRLARAMPPGGKLWTLESEAMHAEVARANIAAAGLADRVEVVVGPALATLDTLAVHSPFDLVFLDADKAGYASYGRWAHAHLRSGGLLVADNAFLFGELLEDTPTAREVRAFHEATAATFDSVCVTTPDGLVVGIRR